jgi:hypothetical protein
MKNGGEKFEEIKPIASKYVDGINFLEFSHAANTSI